MEFRPCIDIHNGSVKQIVGASLQDKGNHAKENFVSTQNAAYFATLYREVEVKGGHIILLNSKDSEFYEKTKNQALEALKAYPQGLQVGGGITPDNAAGFLEAGASHVIVTSYVFANGKIQYEKLQKLVDAVGKEHLVLDLSCKLIGDSYYIVTDRWQKVTDEKVTEELLDKLSNCCDEFLVHAVDVEGKAEGIEKDLVQILGEWNRIPITYAGGVHSFQDLQLLRLLGKNHLNVTIGSALDLFGGILSWKEVMNYCKKECC